MEQLAPAGRRYKSRKTRPCDFCRRRRVACDMPTGPPCHRCISKNHPCTFEQGPSHRKRRAATGSPDQDRDEPHHSHRARLEEALSGPVSSIETLDAATFQSSVDLVDFDDFALPNMEAVELSAERDSAELPRELFQLEVASLHASSPSTSSIAASIPAGHTSSRFAEKELWSEGSLDNLPGAFSFYIGHTGAADVHLLAREPYDASNLTRPRVNGLKYRRMEPQFDQLGDSGPVLFGITDRTLVEKSEPRSSAATREAAWSDLWTILNPSQAWSLVQLYVRFVDPYFPILSKHQIPANSDSLSNMPLALLTAICATALPFIIYDEKLIPLLLHRPSSQKLYWLCWLGISEELHAPSLATLQACLLLQQRLPTNMYLSDTAFSWSLISTSVSIAQTIGLHRDPYAWSTVPRWERTLRRRLWWSTWSMDKWFSLIRGMPSHLSEDDYDVELLMPDDIQDVLSSCATAQHHLPHLVSLTTILSDIQRTYYTVKAARRTSNDLQYSLESARVLRTRLKQWKDDLPSGLTFSNNGGETPWPHVGLDDGDLDGNGSLHLAYIVTHMSLFRALLRPLDVWKQQAHQSTEVASLYNSAKAVVKGALLCVKEFVEFIEALTPTMWNAFWHSWSRANFAIAGAFMVYLLQIVSPTRHDSSFVEVVDFDQEHLELQEWIRRWRSANRSASGASGMKGLVNLGFLRVETMLRNGNTNGI